MEAMGYHHALDMVSDDNRKLVYTIVISNTYCKQMEVGFGGNSYIETVKPEAWKEVGITQEALLDMEGFLLEGVERASVFLQTTES